MKKLFLVIMTFMMVMIPVGVYADTPYELSFDVVKCDPKSDGMTAAKCRNAYLDGSLDSYIVDNNGSMDAGTTIMVAVHLKIGTPKSMTAVQTFFTYDKEVLTPLLNTAGTNIMTSKYEDAFPSWYDEDNDEYEIGWTVTPSQDGDYMKVVATDPTYFVPLSEDIDLAYFFFKVDENATPGSTFGFTFDTDEASTNGNDASASYYHEINVVNGVYSIYSEGGQSTDNSLKTLTVTDTNTTYTLDPEFVGGDITKSEYKLVVPYETDTINISATVNNEFASITTGSLGDKTLGVGINYLYINTTAQNGDLGMYTLEVYRLSNDATLKSWSFSNGVTIDPIAAGTYDYMTSIPYAISNTTITAEPTHENAFIDSGDGAWTFDKSGSTPNERVILVKAENCLEEYKDVPDNVCSEQEYTVTVSREAASSNSYLSSLTTDGNSVPDFNKTTFEYDLGKVEYEKTSIDVAGTVEDTGKATIISGTGNNALNVGPNTIEVVVQAEDGSKTTYKIKVTRVSNDTSLTLIEVNSDPQGALSPEFTSSFTGTYTYTYDPTVTAIDITATVNDTDKAKVFIADISSGNEPTGSGVLNTVTETFSPTTTKVAVVVTAENGELQVYPINLNRLKSSNTDLSDLQVDGVTVEGFSSSKQVYYVSVSGDQDEVTISAEVAATDKATIVTDLSAPFPLEYGSNEIPITVKAENGETKTYTVFVTREAGVDATLKDLQVNGVTVSGFSSTTPDYTISGVDYNTTSINIKATPNDDKASASGDGLVTLQTGNNEIAIIVTAHDGKTQKRYKIFVERAKNKDTGIQGISVAGNVATYNTLEEVYEVSVPNSVAVADTSNVVVTVNDPLTSIDAKATYTLASTPLLTTDPTSVLITVTAEDGTIGTHTVVVTRGKSSVATLDSLTVTNGSFNPSFKPGTNTYTVTVPVETTEVIVDGVKTDVNSTVTSGFGRVQMDTSSKTVEVIVVSEDTTVTNTYTLNIKRTSSSVNTLSGITIDGEALEGFEPTKTSYTVNVDGSVDSVNIGATLTDSRAEITSGLGDHDLEVGENTITIRVESESGAPLDYTIKVIRAEKSDNNLLDLTVDGVTVPDFDPDTLEYTITDPVPYRKTSVEIGATLSDDEDATVTGLGLKGLSTGPNTLSVTVTAQNGEEKTYKINITRAKNDNADLDILAVNGYTIKPTFDPDTTIYTVTVDETKETLSPGDIIARAADSNATIERQQEITLSTSQVNTYEVTVTAEDGITKKTYTLEVTRPLSSDSSLIDVITIGASVSPTFDPDTDEYTLSVPYGSTGFTIKGVPNVNTTQVFGDGDFIMEDAPDQIVIMTRAEDGSESTYKFNVVYAASNDASLIGLSVKGYPFDKTFQTTTLSYSIGTIPYNTTQLRVDATPNNPDATIEYYVGDDKQSSNIVNVNNNIGKDKISVKVTAPDGVTSKIYTIDFEKISSENAYLMSLTPSVGSIPFTKTKTEYDLTIGNETTSISFDIETEDANASITVDGNTYFTPKTITLNDLKEGKTTLSILVTAQDGKTTKTYTVVINRLSSGITSSSDANLSNLSVDGYELDKTFNMDTLDYSIGNIPFEVTELKINATANMGSSTITYLVNGVVQSGNLVTIPKDDGTGTITVRVTAEDGTTTKDYTVTYTKTPSNNAYLSDIILSEGNLDFDKDTLNYNVEVGEDVTSVDLTAIAESNDAIMKINGTTYTSPHTMTIPLTESETTITILMTAQDGTVLPYTVVIKKGSTPDDDISEVITSEEYGHTITDDYIMSVALNTNATEMESQLDNENEYLEVWTADESAMVGENDLLATGMVVKLMIDGVEKDRKYIVIKGDTSGDGEIDLFDAVRILNDYLVRTPLDGAYKMAAYVNEDEDIDLFDSVMILNHYLGRISLH